MSYCRWSSRCAGCDLYVYEGVDEQFHIHVACNRRHKDEPRPQHEDFDNLVDYSMACGEWIKGSDVRPIGLKHDGETFMADTPEEAAATISYLGEVGYRFPESVIEALLEEAEIEYD